MKGGALIFGVAALSCLSALQYLSHDEELARSKLQPEQYQSLEDTVKNVKTPEQVAWFLEHRLSFEVTSGMRPFSYTFSSGKGDCTEYAVAAAHMLSDDGYEPRLIIMDNGPDTQGHVTYYAEKNNKKIILGTKNFETAKNIESIVRNHGFSRYRIMDLDAVSPRWKEEGISMATSSAYTDNISPKP